MLVTLRVPGSQDGRALAGQLADQLNLDPEQVASVPGTDPGPRAIVRFYAPEDHQLARRVGQKLAQMGYTWQTANLAESASSEGRRGVDVLLPAK